MKTPRTKEVGDDASDVVRFDCPEELVRGFIMSLFFTVFVSQRSALKMMMFDEIFRRILSPR